MLDAAIPDWQTLGALAAERLTEARDVVHWAARLVASVGNTCMRPLDDGSHLALSWIAERGLLAGVFTTNTPRYRAALRVGDLTLHLVDVEGNSVAQSELQAKTLPEALDWLSSAILGYTGAPPERPLQVPEHGTPDHPIAGGAPFRVEHPGEFDELARWFADGDRMLRAFAERDPRASAVRCWPQRLELATTVVLDEGVELERARSVRLALATCEAQLGELAFLVEPYPAPEGPEPRPLPAGGRWLTEGGLRAALPARAILELPTAREQALRTAEFLERAFAEAQRLLSA